MTPEKILEGNKLIAEFIGAEFCNDDSDVYPDGYWLHDDLAHSLLKDFEFYDSWNWLMSVVEKIESMYDENHGYFGVYINSNTCVIQGTNLWKNRENVYMSDPNAIFPTKLESTYYNVVQFIKWFNENLKK